MRTLIRLLLLAFVAVAGWSLLDAEKRTRSRPGRASSDGDDAQSGSGDEPRCEAVTASGERCRRPAEPGSDYCWQHGG